MKQKIIKLMLILLLLTGAIVIYTPEKGLQLTVMKVQAAFFHDWLNDNNEDGCWGCAELPPYGSENNPWTDNWLPPVVVIGDPGGGGGSGGGESGGESGEEGGGGGTTPEPEEEGGGNEENDPEFPTDDGYDYSYEDGSSYDPCDFGECGDETEPNEPDEPEEECEGDVCPICGKFISVSQGKNCEMCEGHNEEIEDCMGVKGGKAYTRTDCNGETVCVNGNVGMVDNQLPSEAAEAFNEVIEAMQDNCLQVALLNNLNPNYGLTVQLGNVSNAAGGFSSCDYSIIFRSAGDIDYRSVTAELFHAYQEQYLNGKLSQISTDFANNHIGGSNTEFEEKAVIMSIGMMQYGYATPPGQEKLEAWLDNLMKNHDFSSEVILTEIEINAWFEAMEEFQQHWQQLDPDSLYGKPIDRDMLPNSLLSLLSNSGCTGY